MSAIQRKRSRNIEHNDDEGTSKRPTKRPQKQKKQHQDDENCSTSTSLLSTRMSPKQFHSLIKNLSDEQKDAVREIGFGSLLQLQISIWDSHLTTYLVENFDVYRCALKLEDEEMLLTEDDVESTLGLPRGQFEVVEGNNSNSTEEYIEFLENWRKRWNIETCGPFTTALRDGIIAMKDNGDKFKQDFVVFAVTTLFIGHTNARTNFKVLYSLQDVQKIKDYNWCKYIFKSLIKSVGLWKQNPSSNFTGPLVFLVLAYLDRLQFKGEQVPRRYPAICNWTTNMVQQRLTSEKRERVYGRGKVLERIHKPSTVAEHRVNENVEKDTAEEEHNENVENYEAAKNDNENVEIYEGVFRENESDAINIVSRGMMELAAAVAKFGGVLDNVAKIEPIGEGIVKKTIIKVSETLIRIASPSQYDQDDATTSTLTENDLYENENFQAAVAVFEDAVCITATCTKSKTNFEEHNTNASNQPINENVTTPQQEERTFLQE